MKKVALVFLIAIFCQLAIAQTKEMVSVKSPDKNIEAIVKLSNQKISLSVSKNDKTVLTSSNLGLVVNEVNLGESVALSGQIVKTAIDEKYAQYGNHPLAENKCNEVSIPLKSGGIDYQLLVRSYDDGVAVRYKISGSDKLKITSENTSFLVPESAKIIWAPYNGEALHTMSSFTEVPVDKDLQAPVTMKSGDFYFSFSEADCRDFPDLSWIKTGANLKANFPASKSGWEVSGNVTSPWRFVIIAENLTQLVNSDLITNLCEAPDQMKDFSWVTPGRVMWQWWSVGAPKYEDQHNWFDAAARLSWEYYLIDDGWRFWKQGDKNEWECLKDVIDYGNSVGVKSIVWVDSKEMRTRDGIRSYLEKVKAAGASGIKIDFIPPSTPEIIKWYEAALEETYKLRLLCNFHGCTKPTGLRRTWPHELTREGVRGNEYQMTRYKRVAPKSEDVLIPFTRFISGPADFTPVIFNEKELNDFTWAHEMAQAVVFMSPLTHFTDEYSNYLNNPAEDILRDIPVYWDETIVLPCTEMGKVVAYARRKGNEWWVGVMNGESSRSITFDLNFLKSDAIATILSDREGTFNAFIRQEKIVAKTDQIKLQLIPGGGYFMRLKMYSKK